MYIIRVSLSGLGIYLGGAGNSPNQCDPSDPDREVRTGLLIG